MLGTTAAVMGGSEIYEGLRGVNPVKDLANKVGISDDDYYLAFTMATVGAGAASSALSPFNTNNNALVQKEEGPEDSGYSNDVNQYEKLKSQYAADEIYNADRTGSALKDDPTHRSASYLSQ